MTFSPITYCEKTDELNIYPQLRKIIKREEDPDVSDFHLPAFREDGYWYFSYQPIKFIEENGVKMAVIRKLSDAFFTRGASKTILHLDPESWGASFEVEGLPQDIEVKSNNRVLAFSPFRETRVIWPLDQEIRDISAVSFLVCMLKEDNIDLDFLISEFPKIIKPEIFIVTKIGSPRLHEILDPGLHP